MIKFLQSKFIRLLNSRKVLRLFFYYHKIFNNKGLTDIGFDFSNKKNRKFIVQDIIDKKKYKSYLEIGCFDDELFNVVKIEYKVGVDPVTGGTIRLTSDQFFNSNKENFDCVFIDGLHTYEQVTPRCQFTWNGDVWKAIVECRTNKDLDVYTCYADFGIGVIFNRPNKNLLNYNNANFSKIDFKEYHKDPYQLMNIIEYDELKSII